MTQETTCITVLMGGPDREREISLLSGEAVATALEAAPEFRVVRRVIDAPELEELRAMLKEDGCDIVFPVLHGPWGEGGALQELLRTLAMPYVGSGPEAARRGMDKLASKMFASRLGIPTPPAREIIPGDALDLDPPVVVKPTNDGSSIGVRMCRTDQELKDAITELTPLHSRLMCERLIEGRELTVSILGNTTLPAVEILPSEGFYDFEAKYRRNDTTYTVDPPLEKEISRTIARWSMELAGVMGLRDLCRVDWLLDGDQPWLLEVNTMPGMTSHSLLPQAAAAKGIDMTQLCSIAVNQALQRAQRTSQPKA